MKVQEYVKQYLGESPAARKFGQDFYSKYQGIKAEMGPAAAAQWGASQSKASAVSQALPKKEPEEEHKSSKQKKKEKKKSKGGKVDMSLLGFGLDTAGRALEQT